MQMDMFLFDPVLLLYLNRNGMIAAIRKRRQVVRVHRDATGDDRCWVSDYLVWEMLNDTLRVSVVFQFSMEQKMARCRLFYEHRRADAPDPIPEDATLDPLQWDNDLWKMMPDELFAKLIRIQEAIRCHRNIFGRPRTIEDDRKLYSVLPEKIPADFRLPPEKEFIGRSLQHAGCPNFWDSHATCGHLCNLHQWGPCGQKV